MMRKSKRLVSVFMIMISLVCVIGMFAGCKKSKSDVDDKISKPAVAVELTAEMITLEYSTVFYDRNEKKPDVTIKVGEYVVEKSEYYCDGYFAASEKENIHIINTKNDSELFIKITELIK